MATSNDSLPHIRPPSPSYSDQEEDSCDEVDEGTFDGDDQDSDVEFEGGDELLDKIIEELTDWESESST